MKADKLVENARNAYVKGRLEANPQFMERLKRKTEKLRAAA
jgi:small subunit ribosomal protein S35